MAGTKKSKYIVANFVWMFFFNFSFAQKNSSHFKSELDFGNGIVLSTFLKVTVAENQFTITSPKNADVRIFGGKAKVGRVLGKSPKKGIIITMNGQQKNDSLIGSTNIPMIGKLKFKGTMQNETLSGIFLSQDTIAIGNLTGINTLENKIDYSFFYPLQLKILQDNLYSKEILQTKEWKKFQHKIEKLCQTAHDDIEMYFGYNILAQKLSFSHLSFVIAQGVTEEEEDTVSTEKSVVFEEKSDDTAYLLIKNFSSSTAELAATLPKIVENQNYKNLIVDLRDNPGGGIEAAFEFAKYITDRDLEVGYFLTNKLKYVGYQPELFKTLPELQPKSTTEFIEELKASSGVKLIFKKPNNPVFAGKIYVLTNNSTGSTCEPIVYALKNTKRATIIGEKTYGGMLAASTFVVTGKYNLMLPIADFYTYDGVRLDRVGVSPDIETKSDDALTKTLELISHTNN